MSLANWLRNHSVLVVRNTREETAAYEQWLSEAGARVVALHFEAAELLCATRSQEVYDVALLSVADGGRVPFRVGEKLAAAQPGCALLMIANGVDEALAIQVRRLGAPILCRPNKPQLVLAVAAAGEIDVPRLRAMTRRGVRLWTLSPQLARVLYYNLWACSNQEIADALNVSLHTVQDYQCELRRKTGARSKDGYLRRLLECAGVSPPSTHAQADAGGFDQQDVASAMAVLRRSGTRIREDIEAEAQSAALHNAAPAGGRKS